MRIIPSQVAGGQGLGGVTQRISSRGSNHPHHQRQQQQQPQPQLVGLVPRVNVHGEARRLAPASARRGATVDPPLSAAEVLLAAGGSEQVSWLLLRRVGESSSLLRVLLGRAAPASGRGRPVEPDPRAVE